MPTHLRVKCVREAHDVSLGLGLLLLADDSRLVVMKPLDKGTNVASRFGAIAGCWRSR